MRYFFSGMIILIIGCFLVLPVMALYMYITYKSSFVGSALLAQDLSLATERALTAIKYQLNYKEIFSVLLVSFSIPSIGLVVLLSQSQNSKDAASARWATYSDIKKMGFFGNGELIFGRFGGFLVKHPTKKHRDPRTGKMERSKFFVGGRYMTHPKNAHAFVIGPPSAGKGSGLIIPALHTWPYSAIVLDIRGETFEATVNHRSHFSNIYKLAPLSLQSHRYNPLDFVRPEAGFREQDITEIAEAIIPVREGTDSYWGGAARIFLSGVISLVLEGQDFWENKTRNMASVMEVVQGDADVIALLQEILRLEIANVSDFTHRSLKQFLSMPAAQFSGVHGHLSNALKPFQNTLVQAATSQSDFDIRLFKKQCQTVYIDFRGGEAETFAPIANVLISQTASIISRSTLSENERPVLMLLDEFSNLGHLKPILTLFKTLGGYGASIWIFVQSIADLDKSYGRDGRTTLLDSSDLQIFMGAQNPSSLQHFESLLGKRTVQRVSKTSGTSNNIQLSDQIVPLMSQDELRLLSPEDIVILPQNQLPIKTKRNFWFADRDLIKKARITAKRPIIIPDNTGFYQRSSYIDDIISGLETPEK